MKMPIQHWQQKEKQLNVKQLQKEKQLNVDDNHVNKLTIVI